MLAATASRCSSSQASFAELLTTLIPAFLPIVQQTAGCAGQPCQDSLWLRWSRCGRRIARLDWIPACIRFTYLVLRSTLLVADLATRAATLVELVVAR